MDSRLKKLFAPFVWGLILSPSILYCGYVPKIPSIAGVSISRDVFNPSKGEKVEISFQLSAAARVCIRVFDFDWDLIDTLCNGREMGRGRHRVFWDGQDSQGRIVPDEAYFFVIKALNKDGEAVYDPSAFSGGMNHEIKELKISPDKQQLEYFLPEKARVWIRAGLVDGPLLAIPVDGEPRVKGSHREYWNGKDQDGLVSLFDKLRYKVRAFYVTFPENTIITRGNKTISYRQYKLKVAHATEHISEKFARSVLISPLYRTGIFFSKSVPFDISFSHVGSNKEGPLVIKKGTTIRLDFPREWRGVLSTSKVEVYLFLDGEYMSEEGWISMPYNASLDISNFKSGSHVLTINVVGPQGQIGIKSRKVEIQ